MKPVPARQVSRACQPSAGRGAMSDRLDVGLDASDVTRVYAYGACVRRRRPRSTTAFVRARPDPTVPRTSRFKIRGVESYIIRTRNVSIMRDVASSNVSRLMLICGSFSESKKVDLAGRGQRTLSSRAFVQLCTNAACSCCYLLLLLLPPAAACVYSCSAALVAAAAAAGVYSLYARGYLGERLSGRDAIWASASELLEAGEWIYHLAPQISSRASDGTSRLRWHLAPQMASRASELLETRERQRASRRQRARGGGAWQRPLRH